MYSGSQFEFSTPTFPRGLRRFVHPSLLLKPVKITPFFSHSCALLLPQPLSFDILPHCPGVYPLTPLSRALSLALSPKSASQLPCFLTLPHSFCKTPGIPLRTSKQTFQALDSRRAPRNSVRSQFPFFPFHFRSPYPPPASRAFAPFNSYKIPALRRPQVEWTLDKEASCH